MKNIPAIAQTLCAEIFDNLSGLPSDIPKGGYFFVKTVSGRSYVYHRIDRHGRTYDTSMGEATEDLTAKIERVKKSREHLARLAAAAKGAGAAECDKAVWLLVRQLYDIGFFEAGGLIIGTNAFMAYQNVLGVKWQTGTDSLQICQTMDLDVAWNNRSTVAVPTHLAERLTEMLDGLGFVPQYSTTSKAGTPAYKNSAGYSFEVLTPEVGRPGPAVVLAPKLGRHAQSLRFLDFLIKDPLPAIAFRGESAVKLLVPAPARFAIHKIAISTVRNNPYKKQKDLIQASSLAEILAREDPVSLASSYREFVGRGPAWRNMLSSGVASLQTNARAAICSVAARGHDDI